MLYEVITVLRVRSIMDPTGTPTNDSALPADARLCEIAEHVIAGDGDHPVVDPSGALIGSLNRAALAAYLV